MRTAAFVGGLPGRAQVHRGPVGVGAYLLLVLAIAAAVIWPSLALAVDRTELVTPTAGAVLRDPFLVRAVVDASDGELIESVEARIAGPTTLVVALEITGPPDPDGVSTWEATVDPLAQGQVLPNGLYRILLRATPVGGEPGEFFGHDATIEAYPPQVGLIAEPAPDDPTFVDLLWDPVELPDFISYRVERRSHDRAAAWRTVHEQTDPTIIDHVDEVPLAGSYRYRVIVVRRGATPDSEVLTASDPKGVRADPDDPGTFVAPPEPQPRPTPTPEPTPTDDVAQGGGVGPPETGTAVNPVPVDVTPVRPPPPPPPRATGPAVVPLNDGVFVTELPFGETETEIAIGETETTFRDGSVREGGTLAVLTEDPQNRGVVVGAATGLLLVVVAAHVRRFMAGGRR